MARSIEDLDTPDAFIEWVSDALTDDELIDAILEGLDATHPTPSIIQRELDKAGPFTRRDFSEGLFTRPELAVMLCPVTADRLTQYPHYRDACNDLLHTEASRDSEIVNFDHGVPKS